MSKSWSTKFEIPTSLFWDNKVLVTGQYKLISTTAEPKVPSSGITNKWYLLNNYCNSGNLWYWYQPYLALDMWKQWRSIGNIHSIWQLCEKSCPPPFISSRFHILLHLIWFDLISELYLSRVGCLSMNSLLYAHIWTWEEVDLTYINTLEIYCFSLSLNV